jgi:3-hydroxybutyryl-CoA dehydrogenase
VPFPTCTIQQLVTINQDLAYGINYIFASMHALQSICICGGGTMGSGIAQLCAQSGFNTCLYDLDVNVLARARSTIEKNLQIAIEKGKISTDQTNKTMMSLKFVTDLKECKADLVIEAIIEKLEAKIRLFKDLVDINTKETILASNTSSLSISSIAEAIPGKERVIGLHFFNPAPLMRLVEVVKTRYNEPALIEFIVAFTKQLGKTPVVCKDSPGFIVNHVARPFYIESLNLVESGYADFETIDELLQSTGFKMGPFRLMDLIGNDINYAVSCSVYEAMDKPARLKPSRIQREKVENGELGKKSGKGYYNY